MLSLWKLRCKVSLPYQIYSMDCRPWNYGDEGTLRSFHLRNYRNAYDLWTIIDRICQENRNEKQQKHRRLCNLLYTKCNLLKIYRNLIINMEICPQSGRGSETESPGARTRRCECNKTINAKRSRCRPRCLSPAPPQRRGFSALSTCSHQTLRAKFAMANVFIHGGRKVHAKGVEWQMAFTFKRY